MDNKTKQEPKPPFKVDTRKSAEVMAEWTARRTFDMLTLHDTHKWSYERIAKLYGITRQRVGKILKA